MPVSGHGGCAGAGRRSARLHQGLRCRDECGDHAGTRRTPGFFQRLARPGDDERNFSIKYNLTPDGEPEFIWAAIESRRDGVTVARLANNPHDPRFKLGQRVVIRDADVIDWADVRGTVMQGHYTTRILLDHLDPAQAASVRAAMGWN